MASKSKFQAIRGTRDLLPPETALWTRVEQTAHEVFRTFGYGEIRPPIFEPTELFARAVGGETDIVSKEMFVLENRSFTIDVVTYADLQANVENLLRLLQEADADDPSHIQVTHISRYILDAVSGLPER